MSTPTLSARLMKLGTGLFLMVIGLAVTALLFIPYRRAMETRHWTETPCLIAESRMDEAGGSENTNRVFLRYVYSAAGQEFTGTRLRRISFYSPEDRQVSKKTPHRAEALAVIEKYPPGTATTCWVNPAAPAEAVLEHHSKAAIYTLWWPMIFAAGGAGIAWSALRRKPAAA